MVQHNIPLTPYKDLADYIINHYTGKVVEIGIGRNPEVATFLNKYLEVIVTDIRYYFYDFLRFIQDDVFNPDLSIYKNASLIYSIRPPIDIQNAIAKLAKQVGSDLIIRTYATEIADLSNYFKKMKLVNYRSARFYLYE